MENLLSVGVIIAVGNVIKTQFPQVVGIYGIAISVVFGLMLGYFNELGVTGLEQGLLVGLGASGIYTVAGRISSK